jgi:hypothetical protein
MGVEFETGEPELLRPGPSSTQVWPVQVHRLLSMEETNDTPATILLSYGRARVLLDSDTKARKEEHSPEVRTRSLKRSSTFGNYIQSESRFRVLLTEGTSEVQFALS